MDLERLLKDLGADHQFQSDRHLWEDKNFWKNLNDGLPNRVKRIKVDKSGDNYNIRLDFKERLGKEVIENIAMSLGYETAYSKGGNPDALFIYSTRYFQTEKGIGSERRSLGHIPLNEKSYYVHDDMSVCNVAVARILTKYINSLF